MNSVLISLAFLSIWALDEPRLELRASTLQPYDGQEIEVTLDISLPAMANDPPILEIPWLNAEFGFRWSLPPEQWLCQRTEPASRGRKPPEVSDGRFSIALPPGVNTPGSPVVVADQTAAGRFTFTWKLTPSLATPLLDGAIRFEPVTMKSGKIVVQSNPLELRPRELPPLMDLADINLGVGDFQMEAAIEPAEVPLGQETTLALRVSGQGDLANLSRPSLSPLPEFRQFFVEDGSETSSDDGGSRTFRYRLKPRNLRSSRVLRVYYSFFEPKAGVYRTRVTDGASVIVQQPAETAKETAAGKYPPEMVPERLRLLQIVDRQRPAPSTMAFTAVMLITLAIPPLFIGLGLRTRRRKLRRFFRAWNRRANRSLRNLEKLSQEHSPEAVSRIWQIVEECAWDRTAVWVFHARPETVKWWVPSHTSTGAFLHSMGHFAEAWRRAEYGPPAERPTVPQLAELGKKVIHDLKELPCS